MVLVTKPPAAKAGEEALPRDSAPQRLMIRAKSIGMVKSNTIWRSHNTICSRGERSKMSARSRCCRIMCRMLETIPSTTIVATTIATKLLSLGSKESLASAVTIMIRAIAARWFRRGDRFESLWSRRVVVRAFARPAWFRKGSVQMAAIQAAICAGSTGRVLLRYTTTTLSSASERNKARHIADNCVKGPVVRALGLLLLFNLQSLRSSLDA